MYREIENGSVDFDFSEQIKEYDINMDIYGNPYGAKSISKAMVMWGKPNRNIR